MQGIGLADRGNLIGAAVSANLGNRMTFRFDLSRRSSPVGDNALASLQAQEMIRVEYGGLRVLDIQGLRSSGATR